MKKGDRSVQITLRLSEIDLALMDKLADGRGRPALVARMLELSTEKDLWTRRGKKTNTSGQV